MIITLTTALLASIMMPLADYAKPIQLQAVSDFPNLGTPEVSFYKDTRTRSLAINAGNRNLRGKWARAEATFAGDSGTYDITITTLVETDGESSYRLVINGVEAGSFKNPESKKDYAPVQHTWSGITIPAGAKIR